MVVERIKGCSALRPGQLYLRRWVEKLGGDICTDSPSVDLGDNVIGSSLRAVHRAGPDLRNEKKKKGTGVKT